MPFPALPKALMGISVSSWKVYGEGVKERLGAYLGVCFRSAFIGVG